MDKEMPCSGVGVEQREQVGKGLPAEGTESGEALHPKLSPTYCVKLSRGKAPTLHISGDQ